MLYCPNCRESFIYGYPCIHELILKLLYAGKWKCSRCKFIVISDCQLVHLTEEQIDGLAKNLENENASL